MSALPRKRTSSRQSRDVRFVPTAAVSNRSMATLIRSPRRQPRAVSAARSIPVTCSLKIDDQLEFSRLQHGEIGRMRALENLASVDTYLAVGVRYVGAVTHQTAAVDILPGDVHRGNRMASGRRINVLQAG